MHFVTNSPITCTLRDTYLKTGSDDRVQLKCRFVLTYMEDCLVHVVTIPRCYCDLSMYFGGKKGHAWHSHREWPFYKHVRPKRSTRITKLHVITFHLTYIAPCMIAYWRQGIRLKNLEIFWKSSKAEKRTYVFTVWQKWPKTTILCHICVFWPDCAFSP